MESSDHIPPDIELEALGERHCFTLSEAIMIDRHPQDWIDQLVGQGVDASDTWRSCTGRFGLSCRTRSDRARRRRSSMT